jgi:hypothetical protein
MSRQAISFALVQQQRPQRRIPYANEEEARYENSPIQTQAEEHHGKEKGHQKARQKEVVNEFTLRDALPGGSKPMPGLLLE